MYKTKNDLSAGIRKKSINLLSKCLADGIDLKLQAKQAHWNVKGPSFIALHELFDTIATASDGYTDLIAERIIQLGGIANGTVQNTSDQTRLEKYPLTIADGQDHVDALSSALATFGKNIREAISLSDEWQDADTADIFTEISRGVDKNLWFVEAHNQRGD